MIKCVITAVLLGLLTANMRAQNKVYAEVEVKQVYKGQSMTVRKELYYHAGGKLVVHFTYPDEYFMVTNHFGEARVYYPKTNEVLVINDVSMSSQSELLYYFLTNRIEDMGLKELGFSLTETRTEQNKIIRTYTSEHSGTGYATVEMVHENHLPIYCAWRDVKGRVAQKIYYSDYQILQQTAFPCRITQITNAAAGDSIVSRTLYSNIKTDRMAVGSNFNFDIPADAKPVDPKILQPHIKK